MLQYVSKKEKALAGLDRIIRIEITIHGGKAGRRGAIIPLFCKQNGKCALCGKMMRLETGYHNTATVDHIKPRSKGGSNGRYNLQAACLNCNNKKGSQYTADHNAG